MAASDSSWDPLRDALPGAVPKATVARIQRDLREIAESPLPGILVAPDEASILVVHALVIGVEKTPYAGGFFHFIVRFGEDYPASPPRVRLLTTGGGSTRFAPNLYANGKVCLSILGTWSGPGWSPSMSLSTVLVSIQSMLMTSDALRNEPGYEATKDVALVKRYDEIQAHHTIAVAVIDNVARALKRLPGGDDGDSGAGVAASSSGGGGGAAGGAGSGGSSPGGFASELPQELAEALVGTFVSLSDSYLEACDAHAGLDGQTFEDTLWRGAPGRFAFRPMRARIADVLLPAALTAMEAMGEAEASEMEGEGEEGAGDAAAGSSGGGGGGGGEGGTS